MDIVAIKPLSLNSAYRGRRFTTPELKAYKESLAYLLPRKSPFKGKLKVRYVFAVSSKNSDVDNLAKCFQDALSEKYGFNDKMIYRIEMEKVDVKKGQEWIGFEIGTLD